MYFSILGDTTTFTIETRITNLFLADRLLLLAQSFRQLIDYASDLHALPENSFNHGALILCNANAANSQAKCMFSSPVAQVHFL